MPLASVVDYRAWERGYMPPSEHILIDELSYRGAKVLMSSTSSERGYWLVTKGYEKSAELRKIARVLAAQIASLEEAEEEEAERIKTAQQPEPSTDTKQNETGTIEGTETD